MEIKNAVILPVIGPDTLTVGSLDPYESEEIFEEGNLIPYLPEFETQAMTYFDSWGCCSHSFENALEAVIKRTLNDDYWLNTNIFKNGYPNFSDRDLVVLSGTKPGVGNSGEKVLQTARDRGLIAQTMGEWKTDSRDPEMTVHNYYLYTRSEESEELANKFNEEYEITGTWVYRDNWQQASKEGALQVFVNAWYKNSEGKYYNPNGRINHAVLMASYNEVKIYDTYTPAIKQLTSWNDAHPWALKINMNKIMPTKIEMEDNTMVQLAEGKGGAGLYLDGNIFIGRQEEVMFAWHMRNRGDYLGKKRTLTQAQWDAFDKYNFKREKL